MNYWYLLLCLVSGCWGTDSPGPCRQWLFPCGTGEWRCTSVQAYQQFRRGPQPFCPTDSTPTPPPLPGTSCSLVGGVCQFTNSTSNCTTWFNSCETVFECVTTQEIQRADQCMHISSPTVQPKDVCVSNSSDCEWYSPCLQWSGFCQTSFHCGTVDEYYAFLFGPQPLCAVPPTSWEPPTPPGECISQNGQCLWSNCTSWLSFCQTSWYCGTQHDEAVYRLGLQPSCAPPPQDFHPPDKPGNCVFDINSQTCQFGPNIDPCATVDCQPGFYCMVNQAGEPECMLSCIVDGSCPEYQECKLINNGYSTCVNIPYVPCSTIDSQVCSEDNARCLIQNKTREIFCVESCFLNNGACNSDEVCFSVVAKGCEHQSGDCSTYTTCKNINGLNEQCFPGWTFNDCGTACEPTCESYINGELLVCTQQCVQGCFCDNGLVRYRDRCVDAKECYALVNDPPPINPLPIQDNVILLSLVSSSTTINEFKKNQYFFLHEARNLIQGTSDGFIKVELHGYYLDSNGLQIVLKVSAQTQNAQQLQNFIQSHINQLPLEIESIEIVETKVIPSVSSSLSPGAIAGIALASIAVLVTLILLIVLITVFTSIWKNRKVSNTTSTDEEDLVTYAKINTESRSDGDTEEVTIDDKVDLSPN